MKKLYKLKFFRLFLKDLMIARNRMLSLVFMLVFYFGIVFVSFKQIKEVTSFFNNNMILIFFAMFFVQTVIIISMMIFPYFIYPESMRGKHLVYFAYQYSIFEVVLGKSLFMFLFSILPSYICVFYFFSPIIKFSNIFCLTFFLAVPLLAFSIVLFNVYVTWFTKLGKLLNIFFILIIVLGFSKIKNILNLSLNFPDYYIPMTGIIFSIFFISLVFGLAKINKKERVILNK